MRRSCPSLARRVVFHLAVLLKLNEIFLILLQLKLILTLFWILLPNQFLRMFQILSLKLSKWEIRLFEPEDRSEVLGLVEAGVAIVLATISLLLLQRRPKLQQAKRFEQKQKCLSTHDYLTSFAISC
jgi:hypothetical protein